jgi:hypothetical protein
MGKKPKLETAFGVFDVEAVFENSLGYHAITGTGWNQRTWTLTEAEYVKLKKQMDEWKLE